MNSYVSKPFNASQLIAAIAEATGRTIKHEVLSATSVSEEAISNLKPLLSEASLEFQQGKFDHSKTSNSIDLTYLKNFCEGDEVRMKKYIDMFLDAIPSFQQKIDKAILENDFEEMGDQVHAFRPKLVMMGMNEAQELASEIEKHCLGKNNPNYLKEDIIMLKQQIEKMMSKLKSSYHS